MSRSPDERAFWLLSRPRIVALLAAVGETPGLSTADLAAVVAIPPALAATLLSHLRRQGLLERRARSGSPGNVAMWHHTALGTTILHHAAAIGEALAAAGR